MSTYQYQQPRRYSGSRLLFVLLVIFIAGASALIGALAGGFAVYEFLSAQPTTAPEIVEVLPAANVENVTQQIIATEIDTAVVQAVDRIGASVVTVVGVVPGQQTFFGRTADQPISGSGVIISSDGYILTNNHVVENTQQIGVVLADGSEYLAEIVGTDVFSDLAVLKAQAEFSSVATLGNSDDLRPGETVIAIGSPLGDFKNTVTVGVISATERSIEVAENYFMEGLLQTDAAINQGNSGGPLINLAGEVIGINTLIVRGGSFGSAVAEGLGFAIPSNKVRAVSDQLIEKGYFSYPYLGIQYQWFTERIARNYDLPVNQGLYISEVSNGSPAQEAGLRRGDIITRIGSQLLDEEHPFINVLYSYSPGDSTILSVIRDSQAIELSVTFGER